MNRLLPALPLLSVLAAGCVESEVSGDVFATGDVEFRWDEAFNDVDDGLAALIPLDVMVLDPVTGDPLADVPVTWHAETAAFADPDAVRVGDLACDGCVWDAWRDAFVELDAESAVVPFRTHTDDDGLARVYAVVDAMDVDDLGFVPVRIDVQADGQVRSLDLLAR